MQKDVNLQIKAIPMKRRFYFETEETTVKKRRGWIEIEMDFTQIYDGISELSPYINSPTSWKLLFWLVTHEMNKSNVVSTSKAIWEKFQKYLKSKCGEECSVGYRTFNSAIEELVKANVLTKTGRGQYYFNPHIFWKHDKKNRLDFIQAEVLDGKRISHNPTGAKQIEEQ